MNLTKMRLQDCATQQEVCDYLSGIAVWSLRDCAAWLNVTTSFYRRNILGLSNHPTPVDPAAKNLSWFGVEMMPYLNDVSNLKRPSARACAG